MSAPTFDQAKEIWKARFLGRRVRDICADFDVDPRRLYEIWEEKEHPGSRAAAYAELKAEKPSAAPDNLPAAHVPRFRVVPLDDGQLDLFDPPASPP